MTINQVYLISHDNNRDIYEVELKDWPLNKRNRGCFIQVTGEETGQMRDFKVSPVRMYHEMRCVPLNGVQTVTALDREHAAQMVNLEDATMALLGH